MVKYLLLCLAYGAIALGKWMGDHPLALAVGYVLLTFAGCAA